MHKKFRHYFNLDESEYAGIWKGAIFSFDANILLDLYRYKKETVEEFLSLVERLKATPAPNEGEIPPHLIWLPYQVAKEFFRNRLKEIATMADAYAKANEQLDKIVPTFKNAFNRHPVMDADALAVPLAKPIAEIKAEINKLRETHPDISDTNNDPILKRIVQVFDGMIGEAPHEVVFQTTIEKCKQRADKKLPPCPAEGKDSKKEGDDKYGDAILWLELLGYAGVNKKPLIFVTNEKGSDWWEKSGGAKSGPRREMVAEWFSVGKHRYLLYSMDQFIKRAREHFGEKPKEEAIADVKAVQKERAILENMHVDALHVDALMGAASAMSELMARGTVLTSDGGNFRVASVNKKIDMLEREIKNLFYMYGIDPSVTATVHFQKLRAFWIGILKDFLTQLNILHESLRSSTPRTAQIHEDEKSIKAIIVRAEILYEICQSRELD